MVLHIFFVCNFEFAVFGHRHNDLNSNSAGISYCANAIVKVMNPTILLCVNSRADWVL